jgi:hypothetical protein
MSYFPSFEKSPASNKSPQQPTLTPSDFATIYAEFTKLQGDKPLAEADDAFEYLRDVLSVEEGKCEVVV